MENHNLIKVPLGDAQGNNKFDSLGNPQYDWDNKVTVINYQNDPGAPNGPFTPFSIRIAGNGDIYALGWTSLTVGTNPVGVVGADWIARYSWDGSQYVRQFLAPTIDYTYAGFAIDTGVSDPGYYVTGETTRASLFDKDGLLVAQFTNGSGTPIGTGTGAPNGWIDQSYGMHVFTQPVTGQMYVYAENSYYGNSTRWRIDGLSTIQRQQSNFNFTPANNITGHWEFNSSLTDVAGGNNGTFSGGTVTYATGQLGNAINLGGDGTVDDYVTLPYAAQPAAYTISAWVKVDTTGAMNIIDRGSSNPGDYSHQIRISASGKFVHYLYDGSFKTVTGTTTVQTNTWYFVTITATNFGQMHLYVNGTEEGTPQNIRLLWGGGDRFNVGKSTPAGGYFDGLIDDVRIYDAALSSAEIQAIYTNTDKPTVAITASDATASEEATDKGTFLIQRGNANGDLVVNYTTNSGQAGAATSGSDYDLINGSNTLSGSITIPDGSSAVVITVTPIDDASVEGNETIVLTLSSSANYTIGPGTLGSATVTIVDNDTSVVPPNGYWPFEDILPAPISGREFGLSDYAGSNNGVNHGTVQFDYSPESPYDGPATYANGLMGRAVSLDGVNDDITIPYSTDATGYTIAAWINPQSNSGNIIARTDATLPNQNGVGTVSEQIRINSAGKFEHYTNDGSGQKVTGTTTVVAGTWYHVAIVAANNGMMRLYVNGVEQGTAQSIGTLWTGGDRFNIGGHMGGIGSFKGLIDDLKVFDAPLNASQIQAIYDQTSNVTVSATDPDAAEPSDTGTFTITRTGTSGDLVVNYSVSGTATSGSDFSALVGSVTITNGSSTATVVVTPIDDSSAESNETVVLTLTSSPNYSIGASNSATVTIADNEATVTVTSGDPNASEQGPDNGTFTFTRNTTSGNLVINYTTTGSTATSGSDYTALPGSVTISNGSTSATITVIPIDDPTVEPNETVIVAISSSANYTIGSPNSATVTISDNEPTITVTATDPNAAEQGTDAGLFTVTRTNTNGNLVVNYTVAGTATGTSNSDYTALSGVVTISDGSSTATISVIPVDDSVSEGNETVILTLSTSANYTVGTPDSATVTIVDNEPTLNVTTTDTNVAEQGQDVGVFTITRDIVGGALAVKYSMSGPANNGGANADYSSLSGTVTIPSGSSSVDVTLTPIDDAVAEGDEVAILTIIPVTPTPTYTIGTSSTAMVTIHDNESTVNVFATDADAAEQSQDPGVFTFTRTNTNGSLVVNYTISGTGTNGTDYSSIASSVTFAAGSSTTTVTITPIDDSTAEGPETVILSINSSTNYFTGTSSSDTVTIADNESTVTLVATDAAAAEQDQDPGVFTFTRTNTTGTLVVNYNPSGTATSGSDFSALAGSMTFPAGSSTATVTVTPIDDATGEGNETAILTIASNSSYLLAHPIAPR